MRAARAIAALAAAAMLACASGSPIFVIAPGQEGAPGVERFLLVPPNLVLALRPELEEGLEPVQQQITAHLAGAMRRVARISLPDARRAWEQAVADVTASGATADFASAALRFTGLLAEGRDFQALVMPSLLLQKVVVRHRGARWDGVERRIRVVNIPRRAAGRDTNVLVDGMSAGSLNAAVSVSSLHVMVLDRSGRRVFEGRGGIEFLEEVDLARATETFRFDIKPRSDLFQDGAIVREAVEVAFTPYLPPAR